MVFLQWQRSQDLLQFRLVAACPVDRDAAQCRQRRSVYTDQENFILFKFWNTLQFLKGIYFAFGEPVSRAALLQPHPLYGLFHKIAVCNRTPLGKPKNAIRVRKTGVCYFQTTLFLTSQSPFLIIYATQFYLRSERYIARKFYAPCHQKGIFCLCVENVMRVLHPVFLYNKSSCRTGVLNPFSPGYLLPAS